ncbi:hypothetical protein MRS44_018853 [Fusarium solani]|uniref:uncharacterized protein n=1 Tax=Fusarium solani TaxID=169388 RepID=UPI0032C40A12|nr:hypothetical protein MRS44_018853 [Fusarium solani]
MDRGNTKSKLKKMRLSLHYPVSPGWIELVCKLAWAAWLTKTRLEGTSWDLLHAYEYLLESLESAKKIAVGLPDSGHLAVNINLGWIKLDEYYQYLNDSPVIYGAAALHPAYRWALFDDLWGDDAKRCTWIVKAKAIIQDLWECEYKSLFSEDQDSDLPASKRLKSSRNKFTAWRNSKRGLTLQNQAVDESPGTSPSSPYSGLDLDEYDQWQRNIDDSDALVTDPYEYWHTRRLSGFEPWCHQTKAGITHMYDAASTSQANSHMEDVHRINRGGEMSPRRKKQRTLFDMVGLDARQGKDQAVMNALMASFDPLHFQRLLIRWVACDNVPFHKLESPYFRELMEYANGAIIESGSLPTHNTMREWIVRTFNRHKGVVTELLGRSLSRVNVSFDVWTSRKFTSLLGLTVHFVDDEGKFRTFLLGLPQIEGRHSGENLAGRVSEIIHDYGFEDRVGYFVTDNAESNDTCLDELATELGFNKQHRRLRCCGHIINLVARSILFGTDADAFEEDCQANKELQDEMRLWRAKGPVGKLHNIVHWVQRSGQRIDKLHKLQSIENTALGLEDRPTYDVVMDNATRWNSSEAMMERGYHLRNPLDSLVQAEVTEWDQYVATRTGGGTRLMPKRSRKKPAIVDDKMSSEDWAVIAEYLAILKPLKIATKRLEGRPEDGKYGAIWEVLLTMEWLLQHLEDSKLQHEHDEEPYLRIGCNLGWMKLDKYYTLTEDSPVYLAALVLHPAFRWPTVESQWADRPDWLERGKAAVRELWEEYRKLPVEQDTIPEQPTAARKTTDLDDFMASVRKLNTRRAPSAPPTRDEYAEWLSTSDPGDCSVDNPIQYWLLRRRQYPRLSRMAIDLFSVPAMSSEPERIFSLAGQMVTPPRRRLQADIVGAARCISSWEKSGAIEISK